jgi:hypothetical protein
MHAKPVAGDEPGDPVRYAVALHVLMSEAELESWASVAARCRLDVDDAVHAAWLFGLKHLLKRAGDEVGSYVAEVCECELIARVGG